MRRSEATSPSFRKLIRLPAFLIVNVALLLVFGVSTVRESYRGWTVDREIHALEAQASALEGRKLELETLTKDLGSTDRIEYEARARLGQKKPGERVIVLEGYSATTTWTAGSAQISETTPETDSDVPKNNPEQWWDYFFRRT